MKLVVEIGQLYNFHSTFHTRNELLFSIVFTIKMDKNETETKNSRTVFFEYAPNGLLFNLFYHWPIIVIQRNEWKGK